MKFARASPAGLPQGNPGGNSRAGPSDLSPPMKPGQHVDALQEQNNPEEHQSSGSGAESESQTRFLQAEISDRAFKGARTGGTQFPGTPLARSLSQRENGLAGSLSSGTRLLSRAASRPNFGRVVTYRSTPSAWRLALLRSQLLWYPARRAVQWPPVPLQRLDL
jgi:hypothetical protein